MFELKALIKFNDLEEKKEREVGEVFKASKERTDYLLGANEHKVVAVEVIKEIKPKIKKEK